MAKIEVVDAATFKRIVHELDDNSDFFDPFYLKGSDWTPFTEEFVRETHTESAFQAEVTMDEMWEVIRFLQSYSDVNMLEPGRLKKLHAPGVYRIWFDDIIKDWYTMYLDEVTHPFV